MKFTLKLVLIACMALPSTSFGMHFDAISKLRTLHVTPPSSPRDQTSSNDSSLDSTTADAIRAMMQQDENNANASKAQALNQATNANKAIEQNAEIFISRAQSSTPKLPKSHLHEKTRGIKHSNSHIDLHNVTKDEEWGDGIISTPPTLPPFHLPHEDEALPKLPTPTPEEEKINVLALLYENEPAPRDANLGLLTRPFDPSRASGQAAQDRLAMPGKPMPRRPLPPAPVYTNPGLQARLAAPGTPINSQPVDTPIIEEIPEPKDEKNSALKHEDLSPEDQKATDLTQIGNPQSRGVREERRQIKTPHRPVPSTSKQNRTHKLQPVVTANNNALSLLLSAGLFGFSTWFERNLENKFESSKHQAIAQEFTLAAQQAAAGNIAQQLLPGKQSSSAAFTTAFLVLHACEIGLKRLYTKVLAHTKGGKKIAAVYQKLPAQKRKVVDGASTGASWLLKTLMARSLTR